ncbi:MAG: hypothetical protein KKE73_03860 [Proteobacteria bacterium]|nr:hypothetical protein [Pseudomonadota bacterium]
MNIELIAAWLNFIALATGYITMCAGGLLLAFVICGLAVRILFGRIKSMGRLTSYFLFISGDKDHAKAMKDA